MIKVDLKHFGHYKYQFLASNHFLGRSPGSKWTVPNDLLAKKEQLFFYEGLQPIAASIKEGLPVLRSAIVLVQSVVSWRKYMYQAA